MRTFIRQWVLVPIVTALLFISFDALAQMTLLRVGGGAGLPSITSATTFYVCAKVNGGTCVYNGDAGTVAATISDTNACTTKATPCRTINGVASKIRGQAVAAVVTVQLADAAGTGTDLYEPNGTVFDNLVISGEPDSTIYLQERATNTLGSYPNAYLWLRGNDTTPANVALCGSSSCSTTATDAQGVVFSNTTFRVSGIGAKYFTNSASSSAFAAIRSVGYFENSQFTGTGAANDASGSRSATTTRSVALVAHTPSRTAGFST